MKMLKKKTVGQRRVYDIEVEDVHNFYANGINVHNCATDGGVSVIKDDGTVVDSSNSSNPVDYIAFDDSNSIWLRYGFSIGAIVPKSAWVSDGFSYSRLFDNNSWTSSRIPTLSSPNNVIAGAFADGNSGLGKLHENPETYGSSLVSRITSTYNTGWMNGDIKGAFLSDTDDTDLVGSGELVTNGTFDSDTSGWTNYSDTRGTISWETGTLKIVNDGTGNAFAGQQITGLVIGQTYVLTGNITASAGTNADIRVGNSFGTGNPVSYTHLTLPTN